MGFYITFDGISGSGKGTIIRQTADSFRASSGLTVEVLEDRRIDPLRDYGAQILPWCNKHGVNKSEFLLSLFVVGKIISKTTIEASLAKHDVVLHDRSFITTSVYSAASFDISQEKVWDLCTNFAGLRVPDLAVIVDCDINQAMSRVGQRKSHIDIGLGGKMSGDANHQSRIRDEFLRVRDIFGLRLDVLVLENSGDFSDDDDVIKDRVARLVSIIALHISQSEKEIHEA